MQRIAALEARLNQQTRPPKTPGNCRSRRRRDTSPSLQRPARIAHNARAAPVSGGRYIRTRIIRLTPAGHLPEV